MVNENKSKLFEETPIRKAVMSLALPTVISSLVMVIYNLADTYFVGMMNDAVQTSAVALAAPVLLAFNAVNNLFGVGSSSLMSRGLGLKKYDSVRRASAFGFYMSLLCGLLFSAAYTAFQTPLLGILGADSSTVEATGAYLKWTVSFGAAPAILNVVMAYLVRSEGAAFHAGVGTMSGCLLNMMLDPIFILPWGLNMGAAGAGLATFISNCAACVYFFILLLTKRGRTYVCVRPSMVCFKKEIVSGIFIVGIPAAIQNLLNVTGMTVLNNFTASYGADAVAAMGIAQKINMVPLQIALGFSQGIMPIISYNYAGKNVTRMKQGLFFALKVMLSFLVIVAVCSYLGAEFLASLFINDSSIIGHCEKLLHGMCLGIPFLCVDFLAVGVFQACGLGKNALLFAILRKIVLEIPALFALNSIFGLYGLAYAQLTAEIILSIAAMIVVGKLLKNLESEKLL